MTEREYDTDDFLAHYGVKGMKWGVRNDRGHEGQRASTRAIAKADKKYEKSFVGMAGYVKIQNAFADEVNARIPALNARHPNINVFDPSKDAYNVAYLKDYENVVAESCVSATRALGPNASGTRQVRIFKDGSGIDTHWAARIEDVEKEVKHTAFSGPHFLIKPKFSPAGRIIGQTITVEDGETTLAHYGVKGMRWGVRKEDPNSPRGQARADRKEKKTLAKTKTYRGIRRDRQVVNQRIRDRIKSDPEYAKAVAELDKRQRRVQNQATIGSLTGVLVAQLAMEVYGDQFLDNAGPSMKRGLDYVSAWSKPARETVRKKATYNPKSPFWDGQTVPGSVVKTATDLVRRY